MVSETPPQPAAPAPAPVPPAAAAPQAPPPAPAPKRLPPAARLPINPDLPPDQPLEPGSGPPVFRANPAARIAASESTLGGSGPAAAAAGGKSGFIAAARRAAQAAVQAPSDRAPRVEPIEIDASEPSSLRNKLMKRVKSLFIAASIVGVTVGSIQIAGNYFDFGKFDSHNVQTAAGPDADAGIETSKLDTAAPSISPLAPATIAANPFALPKLPGMPLLAPQSGGNVTATVAPSDFNLTTQSLPSLLNPPALNTQAYGSKSDITGAIPRPGPARPPSPSNAQIPDRMPIAIGGPRLRSAAIAGDGAAAYEVAVRLADGRGVPANLEDAAFWFERAASKGLAPAQFRYASMLEKGQGVKKDLVQARRLYLTAAGKGNGKAMHNLAVLYAEGIEGKPDYATAAQWFRKASQHGIADSQYNLGVLCARGLGTEKNMTEAYKWFALAAAQGDRESAKKRDEVASQLEADEVAAAQTEVKSFVAERQPEDAVSVVEPAGGWDSVPGATPPRAKPRTAGPLSLGAFEVGKR